MVPPLQQNSHPIFTLNIYCHSPDRRNHHRKRAHLSPSETCDICPLITYRVEPDAAVQKQEVSYVLCPAEINTVTGDEYSNAQVHDAPSHIRLPNLPISQRLHAPLPLNYFRCLVRITSNGTGWASRSSLNTSNLIRHSKWPHPSV